MNIVVCADGTWNTPDDKDGGLPTPTNVVRLHNAIAEAKPNPPGQDVPQEKYYHPGVGTDGKWWERLAGGGAGQGLSQNVLSGYKWLAVNYRPCDEIFFFGFSRGAFTIRSLGGMISCCGLLNLSDPSLSDKTIWERVGQAFDCYRDLEHDLMPLAGAKFHNAASAAQAPKSTKIRFVGVWDTVGALGIPDDLAFLDLIDDPQKYQFHDTSLSSTVTTARHAIAIDEMRKSFAPTLWTDYPSTQDVIQVWFPGVHSDVGGGYLQRGLSDGALLWMMDEAEKAGLAFRHDVRRQLTPDLHDVLHDSCTGVFSALKTEPRQVPSLAAGGEDFHPSATGRYVNPSIVEKAYWKTATLQPGGSTRLDIFARERWNPTGLFLEANVEYRFAAKGQWLDSDIPFDPAGSSEGFHVREAIHVASAALGKVESVYKWITNNPQADFWATRRVEDAPWFALIGLVANGARAIGPNSLPEGESFIIGNGVDFTPTKSGYLYCFANDAWHAYSNNKGSVSLAVTRV